MSPALSDAVVVGSGPNGLVAANFLADAGWDVTVLEGQPVPGGAVRSSELIEPGWVNDWFSAFYPLAAASPAIGALDLERYGLEWRRAPLVLAHPMPDGGCPVLSTDVDETAASLEELAPGDGDGWRELRDFWGRAGGAFTDTLLNPFPPVRAAARLSARLGPSGLTRLARLGLIPVRRLGQEHFRGAGGQVLLAGAALHADLTPDTAGSGLFGWLLTGLGAEHGFPVPAGGAGKLIEALVRRLEAKGGRLELGCPVQRVMIREGRAAGVLVADGTIVPARRAVLADVGAPDLYHRLVGDELLPAGLRRDLGRFQYDNSTVKIDWLLDGPIPWSTPAARRAGTVHTGTLDHLTQSSAELCMQQVPARPFLVMGQMTTTDPSRSPQGTETAWAYTHVPQDIKGDAGGGISGKWDDTETEEITRRMEDEIELLAPGFRSLIRGRHVFTPPGLAEHDANLHNGAINGGTAQLHQQAFMRPTPGLGRAETPFAGLYLASASAHPGGGVHGACGANAARAALARGRRLRTAAARRLARG